MKPHSKNSFNIELMFPELEKHDFENFLPLIKKYSTTIDLFVFPEGLEIIIPNSEIRPERDSTFEQETIDKLQIPFENFRVYSA